MKIKLELNLPNDMAFLNYWNWHNGADVTCQIVNGKLMLNQYDEDGKELPPKEITLAEFVELVKAKVEAIPE
jgi:hypothetical protein